MSFQICFSENEIAELYFDPKVGFRDFTNFKANIRRIGKFKNVSDKRLKELYDNDPEDIPWDDLSFPCIVSALRRYVNEMKTEFTIQLEDIHGDFSGSRTAGYFDG